MPLEARDHLLAIVKAALNAAPLVGGSVASLIGDYIPTSTQRRLEEATGELALRLEALEGRLNLDAVNKEEFAEIFKSAYLVLVRSHHKERSRAAVEIVANCLLDSADSQKLEYEELDHFVRCIDQLSIGALRVLGLAVKFVSQQDHRQSSAGSAVFSLADIADAAPGHLLMGLVTELNGLHLMHIVGVPPIRTPGYANYALEVTELGYRFVEYILNAA